MKEILTFGDVTKDFKRLGVDFRQTYLGEEYGVCEVTDKEFEKLCNEPNTENTWNDGGWRYAEGSNQMIPSEIIKINGEKIIAWYEDIYDFDGEYENLLQYLCYEVGCSQPGNVCALTIDLAKYNNMKLSELFQKYQG